MYIYIHIYPNLPRQVRALSRLGSSEWSAITNWTLAQRGGCGCADVKIFRDSPAKAKAKVLQFIYISIRIYIYIYIYIYIQIYDT